MGFSFGGLIAYEMACQLVANGHQVNFVGLLDTYLTAEKHLLPYHRVICNFFSKLRPRLLLRWVKRKITSLNTSYNGGDFWPHIYTTGPDRICRDGYYPKIYNGNRIALFKGGPSETILFSYDPPERAWKALLGNRLDVHQITGDHLGIFKEPNVKLLAEKLVSCVINANNYKAN